MSADSGLKRRKGESADACIERLLKLIYRNKRFCDRILRENDRLHHENQQLRKGLKKILNRKCVYCDCSGIAQQALEETT